MGDLDRWLEITKECNFLPENDFRKLCLMVCDILCEESNIQPVSCPVTVCGDIHGQFYDLRKLFQTGGQIPDTNYVFMGDFVDRGHYSLETISLLLVLKAKYPNRITLIRGNHESRQITRSYGFYDECLNKYGNENPWKNCCKVFDLMNVGAIIDNEVLCVHGGLSPDANMIDQLQTIERNQEIPSVGLFSDIVWSDPDDVDNFSVSPRGAGWLFGSVVTKQFMHLNKLDLICRAHQLVNDGYKYHFDQKLVTVWSAPNYCYRCANVAAILTLHSVREREMKIFDAVPSSERKVPDSVRSRPSYFM